jgi:AraC-like DNA-binding protein
MFYLVGIVITFFLALLLITKKGKNQADYVLSVWLIYIGLHLVTVYLISTEGYEKHTYLMGIPMPLLHGPLLYFYTVVITRQIPAKKFLALHFIPIAIALFLYSPFYFLPEAEKIRILNEKGRGYEIEIAIVSFMILTSGVIYVVLCLWLLRKHAKAIKDRFSYAEKINLNWLRYFIYGLAVVWIAVWLRNDQLIFSLVVVFVILLGYFGIKQVGIFTQPHPLHLVKEGSLIGDETGNQGATIITNNQLVDAKTSTEKPKYEKSGLSEAAAQEIYQRLKQVVESDKPYLNPELTLDELAEKVNVLPHILSQVINTIEQKSFYDYVNLKRVEDFKKAVALPENKKYTLLALAFECGFNSKTAFNRNFKNVTGLSPSLYLRQLQIQLPTE